MCKLALAAALVAATLAGVPLAAAAGSAQVEFVKPESFRSTARPTPPTCWKDCVTISSARPRDGYPKGRRSTCRSRTWTLPAISSRSSRT